MTDVVSVKFKGRGKTYFFDPNGVEAKEGQQVVVETSKGLELAECVQGNHTVTDERIVPPLRPVIRVATADDLRIAELCKTREKEAFQICEQKIAEHQLDMKLVDVECNFEGSKMLFFFTSEGRVDFRDLVKDLAGIFRIRIELRQIGVRDEAKMLGGLGICGRPFCCSQFLDEFQPVSTKMAKVQSLSLNPAKISGSCGRLMCCLRYEQEAYEELVKTVPKNGAFVETPCGYGNVCQVNLLRQKVKVKMDGAEEQPKLFDADEVASVPGGRPKPGEPLPHVLELKPKVKEEEKPKSEWTMPPIFAEDTAQEKEEPRSEQREEEKKPSRSRRSRSRHKKPAQHKEGAPAAQQPKPQQAKPQAQSGGEKPGGEKQGEKPAGGENRKPSRSRRRRGGSGSSQQPRPQTQSGGEKTSRSGGENKKPAAQQAKPQAQPGGEKTGGEAKKPSRRHRGGHKGGSKPQGGQSQPKSE